MLSQNKCPHCCRFFKTPHNVEIHVNKFHTNLVAPNNSKSVASKDNSKSVASKDNSKLVASKDNSKLVAKKEKVKTKKESITESMQNAFGPNFLKNNNTPTVNNFSTTINGKQVNTDDIPFNLQKIIQDSLQEALGNKYVNPFQTMNNQMLENIFSDSENESDEDVKSTVSNATTSEDDYDALITDFLEIIFLLQIASGEVESELLKNIIIKCADFKMNLYEVIYKEKKKDNNVANDEEYRKTIEVERTLNELNKRLMKNRELLKNI